MNLFGEGSLYATKETTRAQEPVRPATTISSVLSAFRSDEAKRPSAPVNPKAEETRMQLERILDLRAIPEKFTDKPVEAADPYSYQPIKSQKTMSNVELAWTGLTLFASRLWPVELARMSISSTARDHRYEKYLTPAQRSMAAKGYKLFINPVIAGDLNAFGRQNDQKRLTGVQIKELAERFDTQFTFLGDFGVGGIFTHLVSLEFDTKTSTLYEAGKPTLHTTRPVGGMKGGGWNEKTKQPTGAYWGITQFGQATYNYVLSYAKGWGVSLPTRRQDMTFGQMIVAAYMLAIIRQPTLVNRGIPVNPVTVYINHNQGDGVWRVKGVKRIKAEAWDGQSSAAKALLKSYGFQRA